MKLTRLLAILITMLTLCFTASAQQRKAITIGHFKDEPVEIVSVTLNGTTMLPGVAFQTFPTWTEGLGITVRNVSESPVSYVFVGLSATDRADDSVAVTNSNYHLPQNTVLRPGETAVLRHLGSYGNVNTPLDVQLRVQRVLFNDDSIMWTGGRFTRKTEDASGTAWVPIDQEIAKYKFPKGYKPDLKLIKARALVPDPPTCTMVFSKNVWKNCTSTNCNTPAKNCGTSSLVTISCEPSCNAKPEGQTVECEYHNCAKPPYCAGTLSAVVNQICSPAESPIIIDMLGNGYSLTDIAGGVVFNITGTGMRSVSWTVPGSDDAFLALDRNGNGTIDSGMELFGNSTQQTASPWAPNGFRALADFDSNPDGEITRQDSVFSLLLLWRDVNHNGVSEPNELVRVSQTDITAFELKYKSSRKQDEYGNRFRYRAKVRGTGSRWAWDVFFVTS